jgi:LacI family transcriptional regulator
MSGRIAGAHLISRGHQRIAFVAEEEDWGFEQRVIGLRAAMRHAGLADDALGIGLTHHQPLPQTLKQLLTAQPTALVLGGEDLTIAAIHILAHQMNIIIPQQLSVVGMEVSSVSEFVYPPLTTVSQPLDVLAARVLDLLNESINNNDLNPKQVMIDTALIERQSVASPRTGLLPLH